MVNLTIYAKSVFVETDDSVSSRVTLNEIDISEVISELGAEELLADMDISDIEAFMTKYQQEQADERADREL